MHLQNRSNLRLAESGFASLDRQLVEQSQPTLDAAGMLLLDVMRCRGFPKEAMMDFRNWSNIIFQSGTLA